MATLSIDDSPAPILCDAENLADVLRWRARHGPDRLAYTFLNEPDDPSDCTRLTFEALDRRARAIASLSVQDGPVAASRSSVSESAAKSEVAATSTSSE